MSIMMVTSINSYTKSMEMKMKWQKKQTSGDYAADGKTSIDDSTRSRLEEIRESQSDGSKQMAAQIDLKMMSGKRLTAQEMEYLKEHDPETYKKAKAVEMEREAYERELKSCKTKEEVQRVKAAHAAAALDRVNDIKNNPNIPSGKKLELIKQEHAKASALDDTMSDYTKSGDYRKLPTEAEKQKAEKEMEEAKKAEMGLDEESVDKVTEEEAREAQETPAQESVPADGSLDSSTNPADLPEGDSIRKVLLDAEATEARKAITEHAKTRVQVQVTPEARKVRQAKAKAAYAGQPHMTDSAPPVIDVKK